MKKLVEIIPTLEVGGAENLVVNLLKKINYNEVNIYLIILFDDTKNMYKNIVDNYPIKVIYMNKKDGLDISLFISLYKTLNKISPNSIHTHLYASSYVFFWKLLNRRVFWGHTVHSVADKELYSFHKPLMYLAYKLQLAHPIAISNEIKKTVIEYYKLDKDYVNVISNGIDLENFSISRINKILPEKEFNIITSGHLNDNKNQIYLLEIMTYLRNYSDIKYHLTILGDGPNEDKLKNFIKNNNLDEFATLEGIVYDVKHFLEISALFILPSKYEGIPLSIIEAMGMGLPVFASNVGGIPEMIKNNVNGMLIPLDNAEYVANMIRKISMDDELYAKISRNNITDSKKYDISMIANDYKEYLLNVENI